MKYRDKLKAEYLDAFRSYKISEKDWEIALNDDDNTFYQTHYLGSILSLTPSGKIYAPWTTNQTPRDVIRDRAWWAALEEWMSEKFYWQGGNEGDGDIIFICRPLIEEECVVYTLTGSRYHSYPDTWSTDSLDATVYHESQEAPEGACAIPYPKFRLEHHS